MSTFDTMQDWKAKEISTVTALAECVNNLAFWMPAVKEQEAFEAICVLVTDLTKGEWKLRS